MRIRGLHIAGFALCLAASGVIYLAWQNGRPRRTAIETVSNFAKVLQSPNNAELLNFVWTPGAIQSRTPAEQIEFLGKALVEELSPEGLQALKKYADFGPAKIIFPEDCARWCSQAGVNSNDCVAFKMEHNGIRAEVVLVREGPNYRILRCNNVKQMAEGKGHS